MKRTLTGPEGFFHWEDFSRTELQGKFGDEAEWYYKRIAQIANDELRQHIEAEGRRVYQHKGQAFVGDWCERPEDVNDVWVKGITASALLVDIAPVGGEGKNE